MPKVTTFYTCEICFEKHETMSLAAQCETEHKERLTKLSLVSCSNHVEEGLLPLSVTITDGKSTAIYWHTR